jgi:hypothetical protein
MYGTIQVKINVSSEVRSYLIYQCRQSNSLINSAIYHVKQSHFQDCPCSEFFVGDEYRTGFKLQRVKTAKTLSQNALVLLIVITTKSMRIVSILMFSILHYLVNYKIPDNG